MHSAAGRRIEHPLRDLQESSFEVLLDAAAEQGAPIPGEKLVDRHNPVVPRMPRTSRDSILWVLRCRLVPRGPDSSRTREGHPWWSSSSINAFESPQGYLSVATGWSASPLHSRGLTISSSEPNLAVRIGGRFTPGSWQSSLSRSLLGTPRAVEDHAMQSAAFQGGASCIKDSGGV